MHESIDPNPIYIYMYNSEQGLYSPQHRKSTENPPFTAYTSEEDHRPSSIQSIFCANRTIWCRIQIFCYKLYRELPENKSIHIYDCSSRPLQQPSIPAHTWTTWVICLWKPSQLLALSTFELFIPLLFKESQFRVYCTSSMQIRNRVTRPISPEFWVCV